MIYSPHESLQHLPSTVLPSTPIHSLFHSLFLGMSITTVNVNTNTTSAVIGYMEKYGGTKYEPVFLVIPAQVIHPRDRYHLVLNPLTETFTWHHRHLVPYLPHPRLVLIFNCMSIFFCLVGSAQTPGHHRASLWLRVTVGHLGYLFSLFHRYV